MTGAYSRNAVQTVKQLQQDRYAAMIASDDKRLSELLGEDLVYVHSNGDVESRDQYLAGFARREYVYHGIEVMDLRVVLDAGAVLLFERARVTMTITALNLTKTRTMAATSLWKPDGDDWRLALLQSTAAP